MATRYRMVLADSAKEDIKERKRYIRDTFLSRDLAENFSSKIKTAIQIMQDGMNWKHITKRWLKQIQ